MHPESIDWLESKARGDLTVRMITRFNTAILLSWCMFAICAAREPIVGLPCEGCELVFLDMPDSLMSSSRIAPKGEPGRSLRIEGTVRDQRGKAAEGVIVYAYHTNAQGLYPADSTSSRHGKLRGWVKTDAKGHYRFDTIRPAGYPKTDIPEHVHMHVIEPGRCTYYIDDVIFEDDPRLTQAASEKYVSGRGGSGLVAPTKGEDGVWIVIRDIVLGKNIPGYPR